MRIHASCFHEIILDSPLRARWCCVNHVVNSLLIRLLFYILGNFQTKFKVSHQGTESRCEEAFILDDHLMSAWRAFCSNKTAHTSHKKFRSVSNVCLTWSCYIRLQSGLQSIKKRSSIPSSHWQYCCSTSNSRPLALCVNLQSLTRCGTLAVGTMNLRRELRGQQWFVHLLHAI